MGYRVITVSREFGSGGRSIGKEVASRLGISFYDGELVKKVAEETGFSPKYIEQAGEYARSRSELSYMLTSPGIPGVMGGLTNEDYLWVVQGRVIRMLAEKEPCVIVGRCADYVLRERDDCFNVFVHASLEFRKNRIVSLYGESDSSPEKRLADKDAKRRVHYKHFTDCEWGMSQNYHLCLDSGVIGVENCADIIVGIVGESFRKG